MGEFINLLLFILSCYLVYLVAFHIVKRLSAAARVSELKKMHGARVVFHRSCLLSFFKLSSSPDLTVELGDTVYLIRFINGGGSLRFVHFASSEYLVRYAKMRISVAGLLRFGSRRGADITQTTQNRRTLILPKLNIPSEYATDRRALVPVLIFSPAPNEVSYVTETKNSIRVAFSGDPVYGARIFTASTFLTIADREYRESLLQKKEEYEF